MLALTSDQRTALESRTVMARFFIWCTARDPETGDPAPAGFWNDVGDVTVDERLYYGSGEVIRLSSLSGKGDLTIPDFRITLVGLDSRANTLVRGKVMAQAPIEVKIGVFNPATHAIIGPLIPYFVGVVDDIDIPTPEAGGESTITLICVSSSRALTIKSAATRSHASSIERDPADDFYKYTGVQRGRPLYFGRKSPVDGMQGRRGNTNGGSAGGGR